MSMIVSVGGFVLAAVFVAVAIWTFGGGQKWSIQIRSLLIAIECLLFMLLLKGPLEERYAKENPSVPQKSQPIAVVRDAGIDAMFTNNTARTSLPDAAIPLNGLAGNPKPAKATKPKAPSTSTPPANYQYMEGSPGGVQVGGNLIVTASPPPGWRIKKHSPLPGRPDIVMTLEIEPIGRRFSMWRVAVLSRERAKIADWYSGASNYPTNMIMKLGQYEGEGTSDNEKTYVFGTEQSVGDGNSIYLDLKQPITRLWVGNAAGRVGGLETDRLEPVDLSTASSAKEQ